MKVQHWVMDDKLRRRRRDKLSSWSSSSSLPEKKGRRLGEVVQVGAADGCSHALGGKGRSLPLMWKQRLKKARKGKRKPMILCGSSNSLKGMGNGRGWGTAGARQCPSIWVELTGGRGWEPVCWEELILWQVQIWLVGEQTRAWPFEAQWWLSVCTASHWHGINLRQLQRC